MNTKLTLSTYVALRDEIVEVLLGARERARQIVEREIATAYWEVGHLLHVHLAAHGKRASYGEQVVEQLAADLEMDYRRLYEMVKIYRAFPIFRSIGKLTWTHYLTLLKAPTERREYYLQRAIEESLSVRQLQEAIGTDMAALPAARAGKARKKTPALQARRGLLHVYRLVESLRTDGGKELTLDLGFALRRQVDLKEIEQPQVGLVVESTRRGKGHTLVQVDLKRDRLFTFAAAVKRVVDGDTLLVEVDCGFGCRMEQRLRLRGIDTPERKTVEGRRAHAFVQSELARVSFVVVKTFRPDKYDRYLADVFYLPGEHDAKKVAAEGLFLNRRLLAMGLARVFG